MRQLFFSLFALLFVFAAKAQQTILIDPTGDGGFENGTTFPANGWTLVNGSVTNKWFVGTVATPSAGTNSAYISNNASGTTYSYTITSSSVVYFYRDITFPAGETDIVLSFKWKAQGESNYDWICVWSAPTTVTPTVNIPAAASQSWNNITTAYPGAVIHSTPPNLNLQGTTYQTRTMCLPASYAGTTRRFVFMWSNDAIAGSQPPGSVDEISLVSSLPPAAPAQPTSLVLTPVSTSQIDASFTASSPAASGYLVVRYPAGATPVAPTNGTTYTVGNTIGSGVVMSYGTATTFTNTLLNSGTTYDFYVYGYNTSACSPPVYNVTTPLFGSSTTQACAPLASGTYSVGPSGTYTTLGAALAAASNGTTGNVVFELQSAYTSAGETFPLTFSGTPCPNVGNITVRPATGATGLVITSSNTTATLDFNGGDQFIIDGRPGGTGTTSQLSIVNTSTTGVAVRFINDARTNTLTYLDIQGQNTTVPATATVASAGVVYFSTAQVAPGYTSLGNDNNTISNCLIHGTPGNTPAIGIYSIGTNTSVGAYTDSCSVINSNIYDFFSAGSASCGIRLEAGNNAWTISGNSFYETVSMATTASNFHRAIWITPNTSSGTVSNTASGFIVTGNYIGGSAPLAGGTPLTMTGAFQSTFQGIDLTVGFGTPSSVQNNIIRNISITTANGSGFIGIQQVNGHMNIGTVIGNHIGSQTATGDITVTNTAGAGGIVCGYRVFGGTGAVINVANNTLGGLTTAATASTIGQNIQGIIVSGGVKVNLTNNIIGSPTVTNSINATATSTSNAQSVTGILVTSNTTTTISGNTIANLNNSYTGTGTGQTRGIVVQNGATIISNNSIYELSNAAAQTSGGTTAMLVGIVSSTVSLPAPQIIGNTVHSLRATGTSTTASLIILGIFYSGSTSAMCNISGNFVHSFDIVAPNSASWINGIDFATGTGTISNNMVRLGIRPDGTSLTNAILLRGITSNSSSAVNNFYHNSVYIGGTGVVANLANSYAFLRTATSGTYDIRNNIFVNNRSLATPGASRHYAVHFSVAMTGVSIDYNVYQTNGTGGVFAWNGSADVVTYTQGWYPSDVHSLTGNPLFVNETGAANAVNLHVTSASVAEGTGVPIASVIDDFDGEVRSGLTPTDIGADAGNYGTTGVDMGAVLMVSPVTGGCGGASQTVVVRIKNYSANSINFASNAVTVTVNGSGAATYSSNLIVNTGTLASGATLDVTMPATINTSTAGSYVFNAYTSVAGDANAVNDTLATSATIVTGTSLSGIYTVGTGGAFATLSAAVAAYNTASCLGGNVEFSLIDGLYNATTGETFPIRINHKNNPNNYTLTIRPAAGVNPTIVTTVDSAVIKLVGADNIIIDGSNNGTASRNLTIQNSKTGAQAAGIWLASLGGPGNGATNNIIKNINFIGGSATQNSLSGIYGIVSSANNNMITGNADNDNLTVTNNAISKVTVGISAVGTIISQDGLVISDNVIGSNNASDYVNAMGIGYAFANNALVSGNTIFNIITLATNTHQAIGIDAGNNVIGGSIVGNNISKVYQPNTSGVRAAGISFSATGSDGVTIANNMISDVKTVKFTNPSPNNAMGMYIAFGTNLKVYHNSINMFGSVATGTGAGFSANAYIASGATNMDFRNNILANTQEFGSTSSAAYNIYISGSGFSFNTINYNDYYGTTAGSTVYRVGADNANPRPTLNDWRLFTNQDVNSLAILPPFNSPTDLHMDIAFGTAIENKGTPVGIMNDIDGDARNASTPDIGADEFTVVTGIDFGVKSLIAPGVKQCYSTAETVSVRIRNYSTNTHNFALIPVTVKATVAGPNPQTFTPVVVNTGTLAPGDSLLVVITNNYDMSLQGTYSFDAYTTVSADVQAPNDTLVSIRTQALTASGTIGAPIAQYCLTGTPSLTLTGSNGSTIQWQSAASATGPWTDVGTNSNSYTPSPALTTTTYYRAYVVCNANSDTSNVKVINVDNPQLLSTTPATRCGPGTVTLNATGTAGSSMNWYASATGGSPLASGASYTTPLISNTTTYYVTAAAAGSSSTVGLSPTALCGTFTSTTVTGYTLRFNVTAVPVTINSAWVIPAAAGTFTVGIGNALSGTPAQTYTFTFTAAQVGVPQQITIGHAINTPGNYQMWNTAGGISRVGIFTCAYPFTSAAGGFSIVGSASSPTGASSITQYNSFFNINVSEGCESPRQAVTATVTTAPAFDITNDLTVCNNAITTLQVNSAVASFDSYTWTPAANLYTDAAATTAYTPGASASIIYERIAAPGTYTFIAQANNTTTGCQNFDSLKVTVLPASITVVPSPDQLCVSGTSTLTISPNPNTFGAAQYQWQSSPNNTGYTDIPSAVSPGYTTPSISATTYYKVVLKNSAGVSCTTAYDTVIVNSPAILSSTPASICGAGTLNLTATATPGATIYWYASATGGAPVGNGSNFTTPNLVSTTTYYVGATSGAAGAVVGIKVAEFPICGNPVTSSTLDYPLRFTTTKAVTINSAWVIPTSTNLTVALRQQGSSANIGTPINFTFTAAQVGTPQQINLGIVVPSAGNFQLTNTTGGLWRITTLGCGYPFATPSGGFVITGSSTSSTAAASTTYYNGFYQLSVSEGCESPRIPVVAQVNYSAAITQQPLPNISTCVGASINLVVGATGTNLVYQWRKNGVIIANSNNDTLTINPVALTDAGTYDVVITGICGSAVTSQVVTVNVSAANTWVGVVNTDWNNAANWCGGIPTPTTDVAIFPGTPFQPVINASLANARNITINSGASLTLQPNGTLNLFGDFVNNGSFIGPDGFVFFKGTSNQNVAGMNVGNIMVNGTSGITLTGGMTVNTSTVLINGHVTLGVNNLTITGDVTGSLASHIVTNSTGSVVSRNINNTATTIPVGPSTSSYNPVTINNGSGKDYAVRVVTGLTPTIANPGLAVNRTWTVTPSSVPATPASIIFQYEDTHMNTPGVATNNMEVGVHNGSWAVVTTGVTPSGTPTSRQVTASTSQFGPMVVSNIGGISWITATTPPVDPTLSSVRLLPNLVQTSAVLRVVSTRPANIRWNVIDGQGRVVMSFDRSVLQGQNDIQLQLQHLASGMYYLSGITDKGITTVVKFVKQ